jgi:16S rRNA (cytosine967-C5)-methyltransferase
VTDGNRTSFLADDDHNRVCLVSEAEGRAVTQPETSVQIRAIGEGKDASCRRYPVSTDDERPVVQGSFVVENGDSEFCTDESVDWNAGVGPVFQRDLAFDCDAATDEAFLAPHKHNLPPWLAEALEAQLGEDFWPLVDSLQHTAGLDVRVNTVQAKRADVQAELEKHGIAVVPTPFSPWGLRMNAKPNLSKLTLFEKGVIEVQDEGSQLLALLLDAKRGEMVADFCAGAGGKTLALGAAMRNTGRLYAFDTSAHRLEAMKPRLARSGLSNIHPVAIAHERDDRIKRLRGKMDRVLVDAPCTGLGTLRRNPDLKWRQSTEAVAELMVKQAAILASAARLLKPGGRLVYATCSLLTAENEEIAQAFSAAHPNFKPLSVKDLLSDFEVAQADSLCTPDGQYLRLWPHRHGTDGFFAAAWVAA